MQQPGMMGMQQPGMQQQGMMGMQQPGMMQPGMMQPGMMGMQQPGMQQPGMMGMHQPSMMGMQQPGMQQPGMMGVQQPGMQQMQQPGTQAANSIFNNWVSLPLRQSLMLFLTRLVRSQFGQFYAQITPAEMQEYQQWFQAVDKDKSGTISTQELQLLAFGGKALGMETAKKLIAVFDRDKNQSIDFNEYAVLHKFLTKMQNAFFSADKDRNGSLDAQEIHTAVQSAGFSLQLSALQAFYRKYTVGKTGMDFVSFISMITTIALVRSRFEWLGPDAAGRVAFTFDALVEFIGDAV
jgi:Ca2+-binding EF-hand superfamily protein